MARSFDAAAIELIDLGSEQHVHGEPHHRPDYREQEGRAVLRECLGKIDKSLIPLVWLSALQHEVARWTEAETAGSPYFAALNDGAG